MKKIALLPRVKRVLVGAGVLFVRDLILSNSLSEEVYHIFVRGIGQGVGRGEVASVKFVEVPDLGDEAYLLEITEAGIVVTYTTVRGLFYGAVTLKHLLKQYGSAIPCMVIEDAPDLPVRGVLYDISRNKVPKLETLYQLVEALANLKYNQLQLYVEGLSFEYDHYKEYLREGCYLTKEEIKQLEVYCNERFIDLVPNQNTLGHMAEWLAIEDLKHLSRNPQGEMAFGMFQRPATLNPDHPESLGFVENITEDMLGVFNSGYYNPNLDETFGLEDGKAYVRWTHEMYKLTKKHNRQMVMWSDMLLTYSREIAKLPKDIILMDWGYEDHYPFHLECGKLRDSGLDFYVCPGTSSWLSITGRTQNMLGNVDKAVSCAHQYGAKGLVMTDWGDHGHWQAFPIAYPGFVYGGARAWNKETVSEDEVAAYLDCYIFEDATSKMGHLSLDVGRCHQFEDFRLLNGTMFYHHFKMGLCEKEAVEDYIKMMKNWMVPYATRFIEDGGDQLISQINDRKPFDYKGITSYITQLKEQLQQVELRCEDREEILAEYKQALELTEISADLRNYIETMAGMMNEEKVCYLTKLQGALRENMVEYQQNWLKRNKISDLEKSMEAFRKLEEQIEVQLQQFLRG